MKARRLPAAGLREGVRRSPFPERIEAADSALDRWCLRMATTLVGTPSSVSRRAAAFADDVLERARAFALLADPELQAAIERVRGELIASGLGDQAAVASAFALIREVTFRQRGIRHHPCQLMGGWVMLNGMLAEMATGEGKTITALLSAATAGMAGIPVHVVTVNDYLAERDARELGPLYEALGLSVGLIVNGLEPEAKRREYARDVVYCSNKELTFDYLRDRIAMRRYRTRALWTVDACLAPGRTEPPMMRGLHFAIVDEADSVLIDEARTPLIISAERKDENEAAYRKVLEAARSLQLTRDFTLQADAAAVSLTPEGRTRVEQAVAAEGGLLAIPMVREELVTQALTALHVFRRDQHYIVRDDKVEIVDEYTGRTMADRSWERGLHQMVELKEGCPLTRQRETIARMTYQRFFRRYLRLGGMSGTVKEVAAEIREIYRLRTVYVPTNRRVRRQDCGTIFAGGAAEKWDRVVASARVHAERGRAVLIGTRSVAASEALSDRLKAAGIEHTLLNARQDEAEADAIARAGLPGRITVATNMAGRGTDIKLDSATAAAGGLHVILTEFHESRRIDRQLFGRAGRQGDPGSFECIVSLDDELFVRFLPLQTRMRGLSHGLKAILERLGRIDLLRVLAQGAAESQFREQRMIGFNQAQSTDERLAFAGPVE